MIQKFFDKTYLINLDSRPDRLQKSIEACTKIGLEFERYPAVSGNSLTEYCEYVDTYAKRIRWNRNCAGLVTTTFNIITEAMSKGYESILIMEDDIDFREYSEMKEIVETGFNALPEDWEMFYFGATHHEPYEVVGPYLGKITNANACHCYAIHQRAYERILKVLSPIGLPIDYCYRLMIHPRGKSYCLIPNVAYQLSGHSDIEGAFLDTDFMRQF